MKFKKKKFIIILISICMLLTVLTNINYAENETVEGDNTTNQENTNTTTESNTEKNEDNKEEVNKEDPKKEENLNEVKEEKIEEKEEKEIIQQPQVQTNTKPTENATKKEQITAKSSNAELSNLGIKPNDFSGFKSDVTSYEISVPESTEKIEVYATAKDSKAKVTGTGSKKLEKGENKIEVTVTAEDGTTKTYTINVIREVQQEITMTEKVKKEEGKGLLTLKIEDANLEPDFKTDVYEYTAKYIGEKEILNIEANATSSNYIIDIMGNKNLKEGENIITILVSEKNGDNVATYQVVLTKKLIDEEAIAKETKEKREKQINIAIAGVGIVIAFIIIIYVIIKMKNKNSHENFGNKVFEETEDETEEELPKSLKKSKKEENFEKEELSKEEAKEEFLNNYTNDNEEDIEEKCKERKAKHKGKRFK